MRLGARAVSTPHTSLSEKKAMRLRVRRRDAPAGTATAAHVDASTLGDLLQVYGAVGLNRQVRLRERESWGRFCAVPFFFLLP